MFWLPPACGVVDPRVSTEIIETEALIEAEPTDTRESMPAKISDPGGEIRVLHVDDEPDFAATVAAFLERENGRLDVESETDASDGLSRLTGGAFDCVVSDYDMPGWNGIEFLEALREQCPELPFILYTGKGSEEVASDAIAAGATDYFQKERGTDQYTVLANRIETLVERARARRRQQRQATAIETAREGIGIIDADGYHVSVNRAYADIYRTDPANLVGDHWSDLYPDDEAGYIRTEVRPRVAEDGYWRGRTTGVRTDGTTFTQECAMAATEHGATVRTVRDISGKVESEKQLNRYRTLVEALHDPVYVLDEEGHFEFVNEAFVETFGYGFDEVLGNDVSAVKDETAVEQGVTNLGRILSSDGPDSLYFETEIRSKGGESITCEDHMAALPYEGEAFNGSVGILRDISDQKQKTRELKRQNRRLDEFASVVTHDLRSPLDVASGNLDLLREECDSGRIDAIDGALSRMDELISDLLELARVGNETDAVESVDLAALSADCWRHVETGDATVRAEIDRTVRADRSRVAQLFENLMRNAVEHGGDGVTVTVGELADGFYVEDDGPGIPDGERDEVFEAGYTTDRRGTGFGLSIASRVAAVHGWDIGVATGSDGGARFEITGVEFDAE